MTCPLRLRLWLTFFTFFAGTIRENILLGVDADTITEEQLHQVCRDASIHDFLISLPDGYNTEIGSKGVSLSGGQKQRVVSNIQRPMLGWSH